MFVDERTIGFLGHAQATEVHGSQADWARRDLISLSQVGPQAVHRGAVWRPAAAVPSASTVRLRGRLGDVCADDDQCPVANSLCLRAVCRCADGFAENDDRLHCVGTFPSIVSFCFFNTSSKNPCNKTKFNWIL